ncbi:MAG: hypothetical protein H6935_10200 [Thiobacillus sp.]|nr:hypothetical protein [Thiobacillus sp.]
MTSDPKQQHSAPINEGRRKLTKASLAAPVVLGTLASRPVLADAWNCTISGQISGNISRPGKVDCATLGQSPSYYAGLAPTSWPGGTDFVQNDGDIRKFKNTPNTQSIKFADAFERFKINDANFTGNPTVLDVLRGDWDLSDNNKGLRVRQVGGFDTANGIVLGQEAIAAYMNAVDPTNGHPTFPISGPQVVAMFNAVILSGGRYDPTGVNWDITAVISYFQSLHA